MSVHRPCSLRGVPKTRVHHLFVAWTPVICFLRAPRRLMRSDWPFNFPFINSVGWRLYIEVFVSQRFHERARQLCNETQCPWIQRGSLSSVSSFFLLSSFSYFFPLVFFFFFSFFLSFFLSYCRFSCRTTREAARTARDYHSFVFRGRSARAINV